MFSVDMPGTRDTSGSSGSIVTSTSTDGAVTIGTLDLGGGGPNPIPTTSNAGPGGSTYLSGPDGVASNPGEPALSRYVANVGLSGKVLRGIGFWSGAFTDTNGVTPFTGAPGTEFGGAQTPFTSTTFFPARMWAASYFGDLSGGSTNLVVTPAQHRVGTDPVTRRLFSSLGLKLFYVPANDPIAGQAAAPTIGAVDADLSGSTVTFTAIISGTDPDGADNIQSAWITYTYGNDGCTCWASVPLVRSAMDPSSWSATLSIGVDDDPADLRFIVQAANRAALVGINDNQGAYHSLATIPAPQPAASTLVLTAGSSGTYGASTSVSATLTGPGALTGRTVSFRIGTSVVTATTDAGGVASASLPLIATPGTQQLTATFSGDATHASSGDATSFTITKQSTSLVLTAPDATVGGASGISATLRAPDGSGTAVGSRTVFFVLEGTGSGTTMGFGLTKSVTTGADGTANLGSTPDLPVGPYEVRAYFSGTIPLNPWTGTLTTTLTDPIYEASMSSAEASLIIWPWGGFYSPVDNAVRNTATAGSSIPIKFSLGGDRGLTGIFATGFPKATKITCATSVAEDTIEEVVSNGSSGLQYDPVSERYTYVWKTAKTYKGSCYRLDVKLVDGTTHSATFQFK